MLKVVGSEVATLGFDLYVFVLFFTSVWVFITYMLNCFVHEGQFMRPDVNIDVESEQLNLGPDRDPIPLSSAPVWDSVQDEGYQDKQCWYPLEQDGLDILEGQPYDYVTEYLLAHKYQFSEFDPKTPF